MIINTGSRTDIPAYFGAWFYNRLREGCVMVRNPYYMEQVTRYRLSPDVVDVLCFCTKNPEPMLPRLGELSRFRQFWFVTVTPYGKEIEPFVPDKSQVIRSVKELSRLAGPGLVGWRYDPIFISDSYPVEFHMECFEKMAASLGGFVNSCVISFIDLYEKTKKNFRGVRPVTEGEQMILTEFMAGVGKKYGIPIRTCCENPALSKFGVDVSGCMTKEVLERAVGGALEIPGGRRPARQECRCLLGADIGMYNTCGHGCVYCYANYDRKIVEENRKNHDPDSPFLIGGPKDFDRVTEAKQSSWYSGQMTMVL